MPIYTKTGDRGETGLASGQRISKASPVINFVGLLDELNALLGICVAKLDEVDEFDFSTESEVLEDIQRDLFIVGAAAVGAKVSFNSASEVANIEKTIDDYERLVPRLKNFILPGGSTASAHLHHTRTIARKIERHAVSLNSKSIEPFLPYLNRLSDLLFIMARYVNLKSKIGETIWKV